MSVDGVRQAVITYINHEIQILAADRFVDQSLGFPGAKTRTMTAYQIRVLPVTLIKRRIQRFLQGSLAEAYDIIIHSLPEFLTGFQGCDFKRCCRKQLFH